MKLKIRYFSSHLELIDNNYPVFIYLVCIFSFNKSPVLQELREDNTILIETKNMLEEQLSNCHKRVETVVELENELRKKRQMIEEMAHVCRLKNWRMYQKFIIIFMIPRLKYVVLELI